MIVNEVIWICRRYCCWFSGWEIQKTCGICLGFPRQIQVNWGNWGDTMGISLTNAMVVGFACQWVGSFQRNPDDNETSMEPLKTHEIQLDSSYRANLGTLTMLCKLASWQVAAAVCFTPDLLVIGIFSQRLLVQAVLTHCWPSGRCYHDATPILGGTKGLFT